MNPAPDFRNLTSQLFCCFEISYLVVGFTDTMRNVARVSGFSICSRTSPHGPDLSSPLRTFLSVPRKHNKLYNPYLCNRDLANNANTLVCPFGVHIKGLDCTKPWILDCFLKEGNSLGDVTRPRKNSFNYLKEKFSILRSKSLFKFPTLKLIFNPVQIQCRRRSGELLTYKNSLPR